MIVRLYEHSGTALVIPHPTGIIYSNQAGGHSCQQPEEEGFLVPIANDVGLAPANDFRSPENELFQYFKGLGSCGEYITEKDALRIESVFQGYPLWKELTVNRMRLSESIEAWVYVEIETIEHQIPIIEGITSPFEAILTWTNTN